MEQNLQIYLFEKTEFHTKLWLLGHFNTEAPDDIVFSSSSNIQVLQADKQLIVLRSKIKIYQQLQRKLGYLYSPVWIVSLGCKSWLLI